MNKSYETKLLETPSEFARLIQTRIGPALRGTDHEGLQIVIRMLLSCISVMKQKKFELPQTIQEKELKAHLELLMRISSVAPGLDYKRVMGSECGNSILSSSSNTCKEFESFSLRAIVEIATNRNISNLAKEVKFMRREFKIAQSLCPEKLFRVYVVFAIDRHVRSRISIENITRIAHSRHKEITLEKQRSNANAMMTKTHRTQVL